MTDPLDREHFLAGYLAEADDHLRVASQQLLAVEQGLPAGAPQARSIRELFRALHTLKGLSAMVDVQPVVDLAHTMEAILRAADRGGGRLGQTQVGRLLEGVAAIEQRVRAVAARRPVPPAPPELLAALQSLEGQAQVPGPTLPAAALGADLDGKLGAGELEQLTQGLRAGRRALRVDFAPSAERVERGLTITSVREAMARLGELVKVVPRAGGPGRPLVFTLVVLTDRPDDEVGAAAGADAAAVQTIALASGPPGAEAREEPEGGPDVRRDTVRVDVGRLDDALDKLSAIIVTRFRLARAVAALRERGVDVRELSQVLGEAGKELRDLRGAIMRARMMSVAELLERVPLIVRGLGLSSGRVVRVQVDAGRAELDKAVAERVFPAIVHLVRNAVDHGLEAPAERARAGKPESGLITVSCFEHSDSRLELEVSDDGRGVDVAAVARQAGRPTPASPADLLELMARPGLSTRAEATTTSGRGMGLDIVKRTVEELGGELLLRTRPGHGTTFTLRIPLSVSILDAFAFECAGQPFVIPVAAVEEIVDLAQEHTFEAVDLGPAAGAEGARGGARLLRRRGRVLPMYALADLFELTGPPAPRPKAIIVRRRGDACAFQVDRMLGQQEVVIRPLEDPLVRVRGVTGTTDLGDGRATLVLDLGALAGAERVPA